MASDHLQSMSPRDVSAFWTLAAKFLKDRRSMQNLREEDVRRLELILVHTRENIGACGYRDLAPTTLGLAKIMNIRAQRGRPCQLLNDIFIGKESQNKQFIMHELALAAMPMREEFPPRELSNVIYAFGLAQYAHMFDDGRTTFDVLAEEALSNLRSFEPQGLSNVLWAHANAKASNPALFKATGDAVDALDSLESFWPQALSNIVWAYATAKESHPKLFNRVADHIVGLDSLSSFKPQALKDTVWAFATAKESHPKLFKKVANHIISLDSLRSFDPQHLSNTLWAYATAKESHPKLFQKVADAAIERRSEFDAQGIANLLWAFASNGQIDRQLFEAFAPTAATFLGEFTEQELAILAWAFAVADVGAPSLFNDAFVNVCVEKEGEFLTEALSQLHQWNLWQEEIKSHVRLPPTLAERCRDAFVSEVPRPSALQDDVVSVLSSIDLHPEGEFLTERGYRLDALVEVDGRKIGIEVDGPFHFVGRALNGKTIIKRRQVANLDGIPVVSVPYWEWNKLGRPGRNKEKKQQYLRSLLKLH